MFRPREAFAFNNLRTDASSRAEGISPLRAASRTALYDASRSAGNEQQIASGFEGFDGGAADIGGVKTGKSGHVEGVGHDDSLEAELALEQIGDDRRGSRGHAVGVGLKRGNA